MSKRRKRKRKKEDEGSEEFTQKERDKIINYASLTGPGGWDMATKSFSSSFSLLNNKIYKNGTKLD